MRHADFFDVSLDCVFGRCDKPQGNLYDFPPKARKDNKQKQELIKTYFDPTSPANARFKETLLPPLIGGGTKQTRAAIYARRRYPRGTANER